MSRIKRPTILIADDDEKIVYAFKKTFKDQARVVTASDGTTAIDELGKGEVTVAFIDINMPVKDGLSVLQEAQEAGIQTPIIIITGYGTMSTAIDAIKKGAFDYITKPLDINHLRTVAGNAMEMVRLKREVHHLKTVLAKPQHDNEIVGSHPSMQEVYKKIGLVSRTPNTTNVLITGESGTGKELVARAIHQAGTNMAEPFLAINCTVLPENLLESELFGHEKGAFTGAIKTKQGKFEVAGSGSIFLDEIGDMPLDLQRGLLRVLEERIVTPVGGHRQIPIQARFITATNKDLTASLKNGEFRKDLFYRLNVFLIHLPLLREHKDDIPALVQFFISKHSHAQGKKIRSITDDALRVLTTFDFPGNVRELQNVIVSAVTQEQGDVISVLSLPPYLSQSEEDRDYNIPISSLNLAEARRSVNQTFEKQFVHHLLYHTSGNVTTAAQEAGVERQSFQRMMRRHDIKSQDFKP